MSELRRILANGTILMYHRVADLELDPWGLAVSPAYFRRHLEILSKACECISLDQLKAGIEGARLPSRWAVVTFDDGYRDFIDAAIFMNDAGIPGAVFVPTVNLQGPQPFWWDEMCQIVLGREPLPHHIHLESGRHSFDFVLGAHLPCEPDPHVQWRVNDATDPTVRHTLCRKLHRFLLEQSPEDHACSMQQLREWAGQPGLERRADLLLRREELFTLSKTGAITVGSHGLTHHFLPRLPYQVQKRELLASKAWLEEATGMPIVHFAYPYGAYSAPLRQLVSDLGYETACATHQPPELTPSIFSLPRWAVPNIDAESFERQLMEEFELGRRRLVTYSSASTSSSSAVLPVPNPSLCFVRHLAERYAASALVVPDRIHALALSRTCPAEICVTVTDWREQRLGRGVSLYVDLDCCVDSVSRAQATLGEHAAELTSFVLFFPSNAASPPGIVRSILEDAGMEVNAVGYVRSAFDASSPCSTLAIAGPTRALDLVRRERFRVLALMPVFNESDVLESSITHLIGQGIDVYVIDNWSTDGSFEKARTFLGRGVAGVERFPPDGPQDFSQWRQILCRVEQLTTELSADWFIFQDADEIRYSPWSNLSLWQAIMKLDQSGFTAADFTVINFHPIDNTFTGEQNLEQHFRFFTFDRSPHQFVEIKAWKNMNVPIDLASTGGHEARFSGRKVFPLKFLMKHYPIRSQSHGMKKVFRERKSRWSPEEKAKGWHGHYDSITKTDTFLVPADKQTEFKPEVFDEEFIVERLSGVGILKEYPATETVTVVIVNYNGESHLGPCIESLRQLSCRSSLVEILVVDNGSGDNSVSFLRNRFPEVTLLERGRNDGFAVAANHGAFAARGKYVAFLNVDMQVDHYWLSSLLDELLIDPNVACVGSVVMNWEGTEVQFAGRSDDWFALSWIPEPHPKSYRHLPEATIVPFVSGGAMLIRQDMFKSLGGFDENYFFYHEDVDLGWRVWRQGHRCVITSRSVVWHHGGAISKTCNTKLLLAMSSWNTIQAVCVNADEQDLPEFLVSAIWGLVRRLRSSTDHRTAFPEALAMIKNGAASLQSRRNCSQTSKTVWNAEAQKVPGTPFASALLCDLDTDFYDEARAVAGRALDSPQPNWEDLLLTLISLCLAWDDSTQASQGEWFAKVNERDRAIRDLQMELFEKVDERDRIIRDLQKELFEKVEERDRIIRDLQKELFEKVGERDRIIRGLQKERFGMDAFGDAFS